MAAIRIPNFDDLRDGKDEIEDITQGELGYKLSTGDLAIFATLFFSEFDNVFFNDRLADGTTLNRVAGTENSGLCTKKTPGGGPRVRPLRARFWDPFSFFRPCFFLFLFL